jgi:hypothetical protein
MTNTLASISKRRSLALVPGMREIGFAHGVGPTGPAFELLCWGVHCLPRARSAVSRVRAAQAWLEDVVTAQGIDQVILILPDRSHLTQHKNPTKLPLMIAGLRHEANLLGCPLVLQTRRALATRTGSPRIPSEAPQTYTRARFALAAVLNAEIRGPRRAYRSKRVQRSAR